MKMTVEVNDHHLQVVVTSPLPEEIVSLTLLPIPVSQVAGALGFHRCYSAWNSDGMAYNFMRY